MNDVAGRQYRVELPNNRTTLVIADDLVVHDGALMVVADGRPLLVLAARQWLSAVLLDADGVVVHHIAESKPGPRAV